jgi:hypothetical protein
MTLRLSTKTKILRIHLEKQNEQNKLPNDPKGNEPNSIRKGKRGDK